MNEKQFDALVTQLAAQPAPSSPKHLEQKVWREIHRRNATQRLSLKWLFPLWLKPQVAFAGVTVAIAIGSIFGAKAGAVSTTTATRGALELQIFTVTAPNLPSTLLVNHP